MYIIHNRQNPLESTCNNASLKKLSVMSEQTRDSSAFLIVMYLLKYVLNCEPYFSLHIFRFGLSDIQIICNRIGDGLM
jgi:hypothetical protein